MAELILTDVAKRFGSDVILQPSTLTVADGSFVVIVGPSGCGKSTLLRLIAGLEEPSGGTVAIGGRDVTHAAPADRGVAMVFQSYALYPQMTVGQNIAFPLTVAKRPKAEIAERVARAARLLDLGDLLDRRPRQLSGGQRQRVSIGRAIVREPSVLLLDEPLSNLDAELRVRMRHQFARLHGELGTTMVYVTHDQVEAMTLAERIVVMSRGRIEQEGEPMALYHCPASLAVATAIGSPAVNLLPVTITGTEGGNTCVTLADGAQVTVAAQAARDVGSAATLGVRPEHLRLSDDGAFTGAVELFERLGPLSFAHLGARGAAGTLVAQLPGDSRVSLGQRLRFTVAAQDAQLFDADGCAYPRISP